jgi:hypothetical protein
MTLAIQHINPTGLHDPSHYGYAQVTTVPADTTLVYMLVNSVRMKQAIRWRLTLRLS